MEWQLWLEHLDTLFDSVENGSNIRTVLIVGWAALQQTTSGWQPACWGSVVTGGPNGLPAMMAAVVLVRSAVTVAPGPSARSIFCIVVSCEPQLPLAKGGQG